jgi:hypothetical protein
MRLLQNSGTDRGIDRPLEWLTPRTSVDLLSPAFSLLAFAECKDAPNREEGRDPKLLGEHLPSAGPGSWRPIPVQSHNGHLLIYDGGLWVNAGGRLGVVKG